MQHGSIFFSMFQKQITLYLAVNMQQLLSPAWLKPDTFLVNGSVLLSIVDNVGRERNLRTKWVFIVIAGLITHINMNLMLFTLLLELVQTL